MPSPEPTGVPPPLRVLIIDDDEVDRLRLRRLLGKLASPGYVVAEAVDKSAGLAAMQAGTFDCVLLDFRLPDGDGLELLHEIRAATAECPPVILQTTLDDGEVAIETLAKGAQDYLVKGRFDGATLERSIRYAIQRGRLVRERNGLVRELQGALARVRTLEGLLPTCAWCKKIKDERGAWKPFEDYISEHSDASCSHGICPDCLKRVSDEFFGKR